MGEYRNPLLASGRFFDACLVTSMNPCAASMPLKYLQNQQPSYNTRFTDVSAPIVIDIDTRPAKLITGLPGWRVLALLIHNGSATGTVTVAVSSTKGGTPIASWTRDLWAHADCGGWGIRISTLLWVGTARTEDWCRITINDTSPRKLDPDVPGGYLTATYFDLGRIVLDEGYAPGDEGGHDSGNAAGVEFGASDGLGEEALRVVSEGGQTFPRERPRPRSKTFSLKAAGPNAEKEFRRKVEPLRRLRGVSKDVLLVEDLDAVEFSQDGILYGLMGALQDTSLPDWRVWQVQTTIGELL